MKSSSFPSRVVAAFICAAALLTATAARAQLVLDIFVNTSALVGHPAGPFYLDFQLNDGIGLGNANNTAILNGFNFGGGAAIAGTSAFGGVTGSLASTVKLTDSSAFNEFFQAFIPGSLLSFQLTLTTVVNAPAPDQFSFAILDSDLVNLPTHAPGTDALLSIAITSAHPTILTFAGDTSFSPEAGGPPIALPAPAVVPVPEPSVYGLMGAAALFGAITWRRRRSHAMRSAANART